MAFCRKSDQRDRVHREKVLADSGSYNPWSLSKQVVRKPPEDSASPPSKEPSRSLRKDSGQESFDPNDRQWSHPMSDSGLTKKYHDELCEAATPFLNALRSVYSRRNSTDPLDLPEFYKRNFRVIPPMDRKTAHKHKPQTIIIWFPELFFYQTNTAGTPAFRAFAPKLSRSQRTISRGLLPPQLHLPNIHHRWRSRS